MRQIREGMKVLSLIVLFMAVSMGTFAKSQPSKREFRGAWIQCVNGQFQATDAANPALSVGRTTKGWS